MPCVVLLLLKLSGGFLSIGDDRLGHVERNGALLVDGLSLEARDAVEVDGDFAKILRHERQHAFVDRTGGSRKART